MGLLRAFEARLMISSSAGPIFPIIIFIFLTSLGVNFPVSFAGIPTFIFPIFPVIPLLASGAAKIPIFLSISLRFPLSLALIFLCVLFLIFTFCYAPLALYTTSIFFLSIAAPSFSILVSAGALCSLAIIFISIVSSVILVAWDRTIFAVLALFLFTITPVSVFRIEATAIFIFSFLSSILPLTIFVFRDEFATIVLSFVFSLEDSPLFTSIGQFSGVKATPFIFFLSMPFESIFSELKFIASVFIALVVCVPANFFIFQAFLIFLFAIWQPIFAMLRVLPCSFLLQFCYFIVPVEPSATLDASFPLQSFRGQSFLVILLKKALLKPCQQEWEDPFPFPSSILEFSLDLSLLDYWELQNLLMISKVMDWLW